MMLEMENINVNKQQFDNMSLSSQGWGTTFSW